MSASFVVFKGETGYVCVVGKVKHERNTQIL